MTKYLKTKEGSIEDVAKQMQNKVMENDYQDKFKKALDKEGKPLGHMSGAEKKAFFNKVDKMHKGKDENAMSVADVDRLKKQGMKKESLGKEDKPVIKKVVDKLKGASQAHAGQAKDLEKAVKEETVITSKELLDNKYKEEKNGAQHFSKVNEDNYVWNFVYDDFGRTKLTTEPDKATHLVYTMEGKDNPQLLKLSDREILDYKKGENNELSKKKKG